MARLEPPVQMAAAFDLKACYLEGVGALTIRLCLPRAKTARGLLDCQ